MIFFSHSGPYTVLYWAIFWGTEIGMCACINNPRGISKFQSSNLKLTGQLSYSGCRCRFYVASFVCRRAVLGEGDLRVSAHANIFFYSFSNTYLPINDRNINSYTLCGPRIPYGTGGYTIYIEFRISYPSLPYTCGTYINLKYVSVHTIHMQTNSIKLSTVYRLSHTLCSFLSDDHR